MSKLSIQEPAFAAKRTEYRANVVPFPNAAQRRAKLELVPSVSGGRSRKQAIAMLSPSANRNQNASKWAHRFMVETRRCHQCFRGCRSWRVCYGGA
jgi:hypothetical protein